MIFVGRVLGDAEYGKFTFAMAYVTVCALLADFGLMELTKRTIARDSSLASNYLGNLLSWKSLLSLLALIIIFVSINFIKSETDVKIIVYILGLAAIIKSLKTTSLIFFQAMDRFDLYAYSQLNHNVLIFVSGLIVLFSGKGLIFFVAIFAIVKLIDLIISYVIVHKKIVPIKLKFDFQFIKKLQFTAIPFGLFFIIIEVYGYAGTIMLSLIKTNAEVGWYNASFKIFESLMLFPMILSQAVGPQLFRLFKAEPRAHKELSYKIIKFAFILSVLISALGILFSKSIIKISFGSEFDEAILPLQILSFGFIFAFPNFIFQTILISIDRQKVLMKLGFIVLLVNISLNLLFIFLFGSAGAAISTSVSEILLFSLVYFYLLKKEFEFRIFQTFIKLIIIITIIIFFYFVFNIQIQYYHFLIIAVIYILFLYVFKIIDKNEIKYVRKVLAFNLSSKNK